MKIKLTAFIFLITSTISYSQTNSLDKTSSARTGINPNPKILADLDDDGMDDTWETNYGLNPNDEKDAWADLDNDKVLNIYEYHLKSNPLNPSSPSKINVPLGSNIANVINLATAGQVLRIQGGAYDVNYSGNFKGVMIEGGWNSSFTSRDLMNAPTIFNGKNLNLIMNFNSATGVVGYVSAIIDGVQFTKGRAQYGPALFLSISGSGEHNFFLKDCKIDSCIASALSGGAITSSLSQTGILNLFVVKTAIVNDSASGISCISSNNIGVDSRIRIINSTISGNANFDLDKGFGVYGANVSLGGIKLDVVNSIIWGNQKAAIKFEETGNGSLAITSKHSDINLVTTLSGATYSAGVGVINSNPLFVSPSASNFYLLSGSPCINTGIDVGLPFLGTAPDMGAYEISSTGISENNNNTAITIAPNPFNSQAIITFNQKFDNATLKIVDLLGREVKSIHVTGNNAIIEKENIPVGVYFVQIITDKGIEAIEKIVIQ